MKRIKVMGLALVAVFAMSALVATSAMAAAPEYGKCTKKAKAEGEGFSNSGCSLKVTTGAKFAWEPLASEVATSSLIKELTLATLETVKGTKITCKGEGGPGSYKTAKIATTTPTFTGCETSGLKCASAGAAEGEIKVATLEGELGVEKKGTEAKLNKLASNLFSQANGKGGQIVEFVCAGIPIIVKGEVLFNVPADKMATSVTLKFSATKGKQKPEKFEGGPKETLESSAGGGAFEQSGQTITSIQKNTVSVEANNVV